MPLAVQLRLLSCAAAANSGLTLLSADIGRRRRRDGRYLPMVNVVLLRPLPFPSSERLVLLRQAALQLGSLNDLPDVGCAPFPLRRAEPHPRRRSGVQRRSGRLRRSGQRAARAGGQRHHVVLRRTAEAAARRLGIPVKSITRSGIPTLYSGSAYGQQSVLLLLPEGHRRCPIAGMRMLRSEPRLAWQHTVALDCPAGPAGRMLRRSRADGPRNC